MAKEINAKSGAKCDLDDNLLKEIAYGAAGDLCPMAAVIGGITAQEVMKVHNLFWKKSGQDFKINLVPLPSCSVRLKIKAVCYGLETCLHCVVCLREIL